VILPKDRPRREDAAGGVERADRPQARDRIRLRLRAGADDPDDDTTDESDTADSTTLKVNVFSVFDEAVAFPDSEERVAANPNVVSIDVSTFTKPENVVFNLDTIDRYGKIRVVGERVVSCFTVCKQDDTLDRAWSSTPRRRHTSPSAPAGQSRMTTSATPTSITTSSHTS
jgi:hypothetical protein